MTSCALCRKSHTLDPDVLRAQFNQQRLANLTWRLGKSKATPTYSRPQWEEPRTPLRPLAKAQGGGSSSLKEDPDMEKKGSKAQPGPSPPASPLTADVGALPSHLLSARARRLRAFDTDGDVGALSSGDLRGRWAAMMCAQRAGRRRRREGEEAGQQGRLPLAMGLAMLPPDVGVAKQSELSGRWEALKTLACLSEEGGRDGWACITAMGTIGGDVGAAQTSELSVQLHAAAQRWEVAAVGKDVGAEPLAALEGRWKSLIGGVRV
jgi:hypothetical protein